MSVKKHARLGASSSKRWMTCPGSIRLSEGTESSGSSPYARQGTAAHDLAEECLNNGNNPELYLGAAKVVEGERIEITQEMADAVAVYVNYVREQREGRTLFVEQQFDLQKLNPPEPMFGTADAVIWDARERWLHVVDYKHGEGIAVGARDNPQLLMYALGAMLAINKAPKWITTTIVQPRADHLDGIIRSWDYTFEELIKFRFELIEAAHRTQLPGAPLQAGDHCHFCPAIATCAEQKRLTQLVAQSDFEGVVAPPAPGKLTQSELLGVLQHADAIRRWLNAIEEHATAKLQKGEALPGWQLVQSSTKRRWKDEKEAAAWLHEALREEAYNENLLSPAQAEKLLKRYGYDESEYAHLIEKPEGAPKLARDGDRRPAIIASAEDDFAGVAES